MDKGDFPLKILKFDSLSPYRNMAVDEALLISRKFDNSVIFRTYGWKPKSVSIGFFQSVKEINLKYLRKKNIPFVRRPTGGKGVYHGDEITYSIVIPSSHRIYGFSVVESFKFISQIFLRFLKRLGLKPKITRREGEMESFCFSSSNYYEISIDGKKIIGSSQRRRKEGLLQHGSIPIKLDIDKIKNIFFIKDTSKFTSLDRYIKNLEISSLVSLLLEEVQEVLGKGDFIPLDEMGEIVSLTKRLEREKYSLESWNYRI